jgi:predicted enzyme related to lactoylglutathione lyase
MKQFAQVALLAGAALVLASAAGADVTMNSVRVAAKDTEALARFYKAAFGMEEVNRLQAGGGPEIFLNFGATVDTAKANKGLPVVLMHRDSDELKDSIPHVIFNVTDMKATVAAIKAAGGTMTGDPQGYGNTGIIIGIAIDPVGNRIELIQRPAESR